MDCSSSEYDEDEVEMLIKEGRMQVLRCNEDDIALRIAAERSRLPYDRPTESEYAFFPELRLSRNANIVFLLIRNTALKMWLANPLDELEISDLRREIAPPFNSDTHLIEKVHHYLSRYGLINVGRFKRSTGIPRNIPEAHKSVVVIGAGVAGISAALQLISFGFDVTIVEGRNEIGGRVRSIIAEDQILEVGADTLRNSIPGSNAMTVLLQQLRVNVFAVDEKAPLYADGKIVDMIRDKMVNACYVACRDSLDVLTHSEEQRQPNGMFISRQRGFENVLNLVEREAMVNYYNFWKTLNDITLKRDHHYREVKLCREIVNMTEKRLTEIDPNDTLLRRSLRSDIATTLKKFEYNFEKMEECENELHNGRKMQASKQALHPSDYRYFNFYLGHEEFVFGAPLEQVQMSCDAIKSRSPGASLRLNEGVSGLLEKLVEAKNLDIRLNHRVENINYMDDGVVVKMKVGDKTEEIRASYCVCTLPIGVLKKSIIKDQRVPSFTPTLPEYKIDAIRCMGNGLVNKIVLLFEKAFWESSERFYFANISSSIKGRGEMFLWQTIPGSRVLTTYLAGSSADMKLADGLIVEKAMQILISIFPQQCPRGPIKYKITRYQDDEMAFGSGSYMSLRTEKRHYEELTRPLISPNTKKNNVFFAGEHTSERYSGSLQGAWVSGLRVAADMANEILGFSFASFGDDVEVIGQNCNDEIIVNEN